MTWHANELAYKGAPETAEHHIPVCMKHAAWWASLHMHTLLDTLLSHARCSRANHTPEHYDFKTILVKA